MPSAFRTKPKLRDEAFGDDAGGCDGEKSQLAGKAADAGIAGPPRAAAARSVSDEDPPSLAGRTLRRRPQRTPRSLRRVGLAGSSR